MMAAVLPFDRSNSLGDLAARIRDDHEAVESAKGSGLKHAIAAGKKLIEAKRKVKEARGSWVEWVEKNCKFTRETASRYMKVARMRHAVSHLSFREAIKQTVKKPRAKKESALADQTPMKTLANVRRQYVARTSILSVSERRKELIAFAHGLGFDIEIKGEPITANLAVPGFKKGG